MTITDDASPDVGDLATAVQDSEADVVILRYPSRAVDLFSGLMALPGHEPLFADSLMYWECDLTGAEGLPPISPGLSVVKVPPGDVAPMVRSVFAHYPNHYAANPLFEESAALDGYVEWATTLLGQGNTVCLALTEDAAIRAAFAVIDFTSSVPDIRLAGVHPEHAGRGRYRDLIAAAMCEAEGEGSERIAISTQVHNVAVMSTWAKLGWKPVSSCTTVHLVRRRLL